jgi:hypothetical protein
MVVKKDRKPVDRTVVPSEMSVTMKAAQMAHGVAVMLVHKLANEQAVVMATSTVELLDYMMGCELARELVG